MTRLHSYLLVTFNISCELHIKSKRDFLFQWNDKIAQNLLTKFWLCVTELMKARSELAASLCVVLSPSGQQKERKSVWMVREIKKKCWKAVDSLDPTSE